MDRLLSDLRYALRSFGKSPGFTAAALLTLALGIGANTAIFSVVYGVMLRPLPYPEPERLLTLWQNLEARGGPPDEWLGRSIFCDWRERNRSFSALTVFSGSAVDLTGIDRPESLGGLLVSHEYFDVLGVRPALGRAFRPEEETPGNDLVVVLSHGLWSRRFGSDPAVVGRTVTLDGRPRTVIGVLPAGFRPPIGTTAEVFSPLAIDPADDDRGSFYLRAIGRLAPGASRAAAQGDMDRVARDLAEDYPVDQRDVGVTLRPLLETVVGPTRTHLLALSGAVVLVLLVASANVANLFLARATGRSRELAVRSALGAGRGRLTRQLLTESVLLGLSGGALGVLLGVWGVELLKWIAPPGSPRIGEVRLDGMVMLFTLAVSLATGLAFGLVPALGASGKTLTVALHEEGRGGASRAKGRLRGALVVVELALGLVLLVSAGLLLRSLGNLATTDPGFRAAGAAAGRLVFNSARFPEPHQVAAALAAIEERLAERPGILGVGSVSTLPLSGSQNDISFGIEGRLPAAGEEPGTDFRIVTLGYFQTLGIPLVRGRLFQPGDHAQAPLVALVSERFAELYFPGEDPIGRRLRVGAVRADDSPWWTIVGIVGGVRDNALERPPDPEIYGAYAQRPRRYMTVVARSAGDPEAVLGALRETVAEVDPEQAVGNLSTLEDLVRRSLAPARFTGSLLSAFAAVGLALAAVGIYGVVAYAVARRTREIGIRMALGAEARSVLSLVLSWGGSLVGLGVALGLPAALGAGKAVSGLLFGVEPADPAILAGVTLLLTAVALAACLVPAVRACRIDPMRTLRSE
jgi:putative ABC transport system permease protein